MSLTLFSLVAALPLAAGAAAGIPASAMPAAVTDALQRPAVQSRNAAQSVLLGAAKAGKRIVAVGERGLILFSDDNGQRWQQAPVPTSVTLTALRFADTRNGVAVGHAGVVLTTADAGASWQLALDGRRIAALALAAATADRDDAAIRDAERLLADGADKPLLDVCLLGPGRMLVVGAYGLALASEDGGSTWAPWMRRMDNPKGLHLNTVRRRGDTILIGGERGLALLSRDGGRSFQRLNLPYQGSFFTAELPGDGGMVLAGLRGNAWQSVDGGGSWKQLASPMPVSITASAERADGTLVFANQAGMLLTRRGHALVPAPARPMAPLNGILEMDNGGLLALSVQGAIALGAAR